MTKSLEQYCLNLKQEKKKALVTYITAGLDNWIDTAKTCQDSGADIIEMGLPFSDPIMDGPVISHASSVALANGSRTLDLIEQISNLHLEIPVAIMTYTNVLFSHGLDKIVPVLEQSNIKGLIIPDTSYEHQELFNKELEDRDICFIPLVSSTTAPERRKQILSAAQGFIYCVAIKGVTGQDQKIDVDFISELHTDLAKYSGVGIRTEEDARATISSCDGVIVGTSIVEKMLNSQDAQKDIGEFLKKIRNAIDGDNG